jgi:hypothetical protein
VGARPPPRVGGVWWLLLAATLAAGCGLLPMGPSLSVEVQRQTDISRDLAVELRIINQSLVAIALEAAHAGRGGCSCRCGDP